MCGIRAISKIALNQYVALFIVGGKESWKKLQLRKSNDGLQDWFLSAVGLD